MTDKPCEVSRRSVTTMTVTTDISNTADTIDTRDIAERITELEQIEDELLVDGEPTDIDEYSEAHDELVLLRELFESVGFDAEDGVTLIRDSYFKEYAHELADDLEYFHDPVALRWPLTCIDWDQAARELRYDYSAVDYDGVTYWFNN